MIKFNIITLFPQLIQPHLQELPFKKAIEKNLIEVNLINLRNYALDQRGTVDDKPYGGGTGMILRIEPLYKALTDLNEGNLPIDYSQKTAEIKVSAEPVIKKAIILLSPKGKRLNQEMVNHFKEYQDITIINGRYEGIDARVEDYVTDIVSIGDFVLSGGELGSLVIMESLTRLLPGVLEKSDAAEIESFQNETLEFPQYTRPEEFNGKKVPEVLLSGHHAQIEKWRQENSLPTNTPNNK